MTDTPSWGTAGTGEGQGPDLPSWAPPSGQAAQGPAQLTGPDGVPALAAPKDSMIDIQRIEGQVRESSIRKVGEVVDAHPEEALAILRSWLHQPV